MNHQEPPSKAKDNTSNGDTDSEKGAPDGSKDKVNLEESNEAQKDVEVQSPDISAKGPNPGSEDVKASESDPDQNNKDKIENEEDAVDDKDTVEVVKEPKIDTPLETDFQKQMSSETKDPPQSNFFSYFIVLAIITIIVYLVFHNKKKVIWRVKKFFLNNLTILRSWVLLWREGVEGSLVGGDLEAGSIGSSIQTWR